MALLNDAVDFKKLDVRMVERNIARGVISQDDLEKALRKLPDDEENAEWVSLDELVEEPDEAHFNGKATTAQDAH